MACEIHYDKERAKSLEGLDNYCGTNCKQFYSYFVTVIEDINASGNLQFKQEFKDYWGNEEPLDINETDPIKLRDAIIGFYNKKYPRVSDFNRETRGFDKVSDFGYTNVGAREEAKKHFANKMFAIYNRLQNLGEKEKINELIRREFTAALADRDDLTNDEKEKIIQRAIKTEYAKYRKIYCVRNTISTFNITLANRLSKITGIDAKEIKKNLTPNNRHYIDKLLEGYEDKVNLQLQNLIACYTEYSATDLYESLGLEKPDTATFTDARSEFIEEVLWDSRLGDVRYDKVITENDKLEQQEQNQTNVQDPDADAETKTDDMDYDTSITSLNNKTGEYVTFMTHLGAPVRTLLGSLKKMVNDDMNEGKFKADTDNALGIADVMDPNLCATVLYHKGRFGNPQEMLDSIKLIAETVPGFGAFSELHEILKNDINKQIQFFTVFSRTVIGKTETVVRNGEKQLRISNGDIDTNSVVKFGFVNAIKGTALDVDANYVRSLMVNSQFNIQTAIENYDQTNDDGSQCRDLCDKLYSYLKLYYPHIDNMSIRNFIMLNKNNNGVVDRKANMNLLLTQINNTIKGAIETKKNYDIKQASITIAYENNRKLKEAREKAGEEVSSIGMQDLSELYAAGYVSDDSTAAATQLANLLTDYTLISNPLNSRNVHGNQSSDVINNSMLTNIKSILSSRLNSPAYNKNEAGMLHVDWSNTPIMKLANHRFNQNGTDVKDYNKQYDFSNILVEHRDDEGNILNYGLFYWDENEEKYLPTEYFANLIQIRLFNGASNLDDGSNIAYKEMSKGDYIGTAWINFFHSTNGIPGVENAADYFMRIPSDAPKTFTITAPKYSIHDTVLDKDLLYIGNEREINKEITELLKKVTDMRVDSMTSVKESKDPVYVGKHSKRLNTSALIEHIQAIDGRTVDIKIPLNKQQSLPEDEKNKVRIAFRYASSKEDTNDMNVYVMEGYYYRGTLHEAQFVGFAPDKVNEETNQTIPSINPEVFNDIRTAMWTSRSKMVGVQGAIQWKITQDHQIVKQFRNVFRQELTDMATAIRVMFKTQVHAARTESANGVHMNTIALDPDTNEPVLNIGGVIKSNTDHNGLSPIYHFDDEHEDGKGPIWKIENGRIKLTGKVFTSDRFILYDYFGKNGEEEIRNFGQEILDEAFVLCRDGNTDPDLLLCFDDAGNVVLTDKQTEIINRKIEEFILKYIEHTTHRLEAVSEFIGLDEEIANINAESVTSKAKERTNRIAEFILNTHLAYVGFNDLFEGDTKFYKNSQTFLKRAKEAQGSGVPYGIMDLTREFQPGHIKIDSPLDTASFNLIQANGESKPYPIEMYATFRGLTVYNTIRTDYHMLDNLKSQLMNEDVMGKNVLTEEQADTLLYGPKNEKGERDGGYQKTTVNDAQSYITFDEWVRRITARGQLPKYKKLIDKILDENIPLTVNDVQEFIQVQKNFYYDQYYNKDTRVVSPRQIKNAEFVLVPRLIKGTELEKVEKMMRMLNIDQLNTVETSKAGQCARFTLWDHNGHIAQDILDDIDKNEGEAVSDIMKNGPQAVEEYNYNYLYTQQETPQHVDSENKAAIQLMKKIIDNIDDTSPKHLKDSKDAFFNIYAEKIKRSFESLMKRFNVTLDDDGNIKLDGNGNIEGIDYNIFYDALKDELMRLGLDSNMIDYCTLDPRAITAVDTIMPNFMSLVASKFENIVQSLFNHAITRQTLPGFHAAQVTGMGFRPLGELVKDYRTSNILQYHPKLYKHKSLKDKIITEREYDNLPANEQSDYEENGIADYIEIMLPANNFGLDRNSDRYKGKTKEQQDKMMLDDLRAEGLDEILGYRIPTEGKQSICKMKVVGFTDDAYGSTIVVPDAWVSQTGADFDIDSIYGVQYHTWFDKNGKIHRTNYIQKDKFTKYDWFEYVRKNTRYKRPGIDNDSFNKALDETKKERREFYKDNKPEKNKYQKEEQEAFEALPKQAVWQVISAHKDIQKKYNKKAKELTRPEYLEQTVAEIQNLNTLLESSKNDELDRPLMRRDIKNIKAYIKVLEKIQKDIIETENIDFDFSSALNARLEAIRQEQIDDYSKVAKEKDLLSLDEYLEQANANPELFNSSEALDNELLNLMKTMLTDPASLEENLSRSNFDDVLAALKACIENSNMGKERKARTPYNFLDQAEYQEDAMSGAKLKAFSVVRDTFCSICNTLKPTLENNSFIKVFYSADEYNESDLKKRFGDKNVEKDKTNNGFIVKHTMFGWSNDNKNVDGKILTAYSSQTTAHILDAMKSGNVPNVNDLTFQVYKTIVDIGSNYDTAVSFIMQPGVRRIVDAYNATNSIYAKDKGANYALKAIRTILDDLNIEYRYEEDMEALVKKVNIFYGRAAGELFGDKFNFSSADIDNANIALNSKLQKDRLHESGIFKNGTENYSAETIKLLYDLQTVLQYNKLEKLGNDIRQAARVSNPDKFGAKQSIFATREVFDSLASSIIDSRNQDGGSDFRLQVVKTNADGSPIKENGIVAKEHLLSAIYPGIESYEKGDDVLNYIISSPDFIAKSKYKPLASFLKFATATSVKINKTLFITQSDEFIDIIKNRDTGLASKLSNGNRITEKVAKSFQNYIVNYIVLQSEFLQAPLKYNMGTGFARGFEYNGLAPGEYNLDEVNRVFGYGHPASISFRQNISQTPCAYEGTIPNDENVVFVYPSAIGKQVNTAASQRAKEEFGGYNEDEGLQGNAYALPIQNFEDLDPDDAGYGVKGLANKIRALYKIAKENPTKRFMISMDTNADEKNIAGQTGAELMQAFKLAGVQEGKIPANVYFSKKWIDSGGLGREVEIEKKFTVKDINSPTQNEVDDFCKLSPAQKITWIKQNFREASLFSYITTRLFNERSTRDGKSGMQSIRFDDEAVNIEQIRREFEEAYTSRNPLIACAAADIVKYAFFVEGFSMGMGNVSKVIKNSVLIEDGRIKGTRIVRESKERMAQIDHYMRADDYQTQGEIIENYIRSHSSFVGINTYNVSKVPGGKKTVFDLIRRDEDLIVIPASSETNKDKLERYGITYVDKNNETIDNHYVKLKFDDRTILYKIKPVEFSNENKMYFLIPLNELELNENSEFSANLANNIYPSQEYYNILIENYVDKLEGTDNAGATYDKATMDKEVKALSARKKEFKGKQANEVDAKMPVEISDINDGSYAPFLRQLKEWYPKQVKRAQTVKYIRNNVLRRHVKEFGSKYALRQKLDLGEFGEHWFKITKVPLSTIVNSKTFDVIGKYTGENYDKAIADKDAKYEELINLVRGIAKHTPGHVVYTFEDSIYKVEVIEDSIKLDDTANFSTIADVATQSVRSIYRRTIEKKDEVGGRIVQTWRDQGIEAKRDIVNAHTEDVIISTAKYLEALAEKVEGDIKRFMPDPDGNGFLSVNDDKCIAAVKKDPIQRRRYLKTLLEPKAIIDEFGLIDELDIESQDPHMQQYLSKIKTAISKMRNLPQVAEAYDKFARAYLDASSNNPLIRQGFLSVLDGFYRTNWFNATFNDIQETSNPLVQVAMSNFQSDLRAKQFQAQRMVEDFLKHIEDIKTRAKKEGYAINWDNIVDEAGRWVRTHNDKFLEDRDRLQKAYNDARHYADKLLYQKGIDDDEFLDAKVKELEAKLEYDEWKVKHIEQEVVDDYYIEKNKNLHKALYGNDTEELKEEILYQEFGTRNYQTAIDKMADAMGVQEAKSYVNSKLKLPVDKKAIARYEATRRLRAELRNKYLSDAENKDLDAQIERLDDKMSKMLYGNNDALFRYINKNSEIEHHYFKYDEKYNFQNVLEENLKIIDEYENSDMPYTRYKDTPEYVKAKAWIKRNARFEPEEGVRSSLNEAYEILGDAERSRKVLTIKRNKKYQNKFGEFDPTLLPDDQIDKLKENQKQGYKKANPVSDGYTDRTLLSNQDSDAEIYSSEFYDKVAGPDSAKSKTNKKSWRKCVTRINEILAKYYDAKTREIKLEDIPNNEEGLSDLKELEELYDELGRIRGKKKDKATRKFIEENVDSGAYNERKFISDEAYVNSLPRGQFKTRLTHILYGIDYDGNREPNKFLYGVLKPKASVKHKFIEADRTRAIKIINKYSERKLSNEWYNANQEARRTLSIEEYKKWLERNTVYNPYTNAVEPLSVWWIYEIDKGQGSYFPKYDQTNRRPMDGHFSHRDAVKMIENNEWEQYGEVGYKLDKERLLDKYGSIVLDDKWIKEHYPLYEYDDLSITPKVIQDTYFPELDFVNKKYNKNVGHSGNYKSGSNPEYDNNKAMNKFEREMMTYCRTILMSLANTQDAQRYLENGWLPARHKGKPNTAKGWVEELLKTLGFASESYDPEDYYEDVAYSKDRPNVMPMLEKVKSMGSKTIPRKPVKKPGMSDADYNAELQKWEKKKAEITKTNLQEHINNLDRDFENVIADFIVRAATYNAVQDNKYELFYAQQLLKTHGAYVTAYNKKGQLRFKKDVSSGTGAEAEYLRRPDKYLIEQFDNQLRRIIYNQFKQGNNPKIMKIMSVLQSVTSAQYMMLNVKGGIANVTLGESQILGEAFAGEFFGKVDWAKSKLFYSGGIFDYILHSNDEYASTLAGAIIKFMDVVDYDEHTGVSRLTKDAYEIMRKVRDFGYTPQTAGEHFMQNSAMFAMMTSHRLVKVEDVAAMYNIENRHETFGAPKYCAMNISEYTNYLHEKALLDILDNDDAIKEKYLKWKEGIVNDANEFKEYAWYQKDLTTQFVRTQDKAIQRKFLERKDDLVKEAKKEFADDTKHPTIMSQLELGSDGKLAFKKDSWLAEIDIPKEDGSPSDALRFMANFKGRVISVNKYIHGVYDKSGRAMIERTYLGSLLMQYHKHLPLGIMKRYRYRGMYSEERGAVVRGSYSSLIDFIRLPITKHKELLRLNNEQHDALKSLQEIMKGYLDFALNFKLNYKLLPDYEKANIRRLKGDLYGVAAALFLTVAIRAGADDDDEDTLLYNLALYEADRLATEAGQYIPFVAYTEAKKLWQSPIAAGSGITDLLSSVNLLCHMILDGDEFDGEYKSGKFAGENKLSVYLQRRIPIWRGIKSSFIDIKQNNTFYKVGENVIGFFNVDEKAEHLREYLNN